MKKLTLTCLVAAIFCSMATTVSAAPPTIPKVEPKDKICFAMYTVQNKTLKMMVQLYPLADGESREVNLEVKKLGMWRKVATEKVRENYYYPESSRNKFQKRDWAHAKAWNLCFRVENWNDSKEYQYRVTALDGVAIYTGKIRKSPVDKEEIVVAAFTGNSNGDRSQRDDIVRNVKAHDADLLFFSGDQSYDHRQHLAAWLLFGSQFGEITKDRPTVAIPDDHDVGQGNLWGESGKVSKIGGGSDGGYTLPAQYVKEVEFAQTCNLPDAFDPTPIQQGIGVYYTSLNVGGVDFAIIEDRKFKTGPAGKVPKMGPRPDHIRTPGYNYKAVDIPEAKLLGERQLDFLDKWGQDWKDASMKCVLSATIFANAAHLHGGKGNRLLADMDSNGWPQTGRNKALKSIRKSFSFMLAGDQHLATIIHHGVDDFDDSGWSFCVPSIVNYYNRWWWPVEKAEKKVESPLEFAGSFFDGFHNRVTLHAYANPGENNDITPLRKYVSRAAGHGIVRFNKKKRTITMECWPRGADVTKPDARQYPGWPKTITQADNYSRKAVAHLPTLQIKGMKDAVVQVINETTKEVVYTIRIKGSSFRPKVFDAKVAYTVIVGDQKEKETVLKNVKPSDDKVIKVKL